MDRMRPSEGCDSSSTLLESAMDILSLTPDRIRQGQLLKLLPELYGLKEYAENNPWHKEQNVFDHIVGVFDGLLQILRSSSFSQDEKMKNRYFGQAIGNMTRKEILYLAVLLHDIAKAKTLTIDPKTKQTFCPGHEAFGSYLSRQYGKRFGLNSKSIDHLSFIVLHHGLVHDFLNQSIQKQENDRYFDYLKQIVGNAYVELLLLAYADMLGSDLPTLDKEAFTQREKMLVDHIKTSF